MALYLLVRVGGERVALPTAKIEAVVELDAVTPVPRSPPHVAGLAALRSRLVTVIDARIALSMPAQPPRSPLEAVIVTVDGHCYGLVVDAVEDVAEAGEAQPLLSPLPGGWNRASQALVDIAGTLVLLIDPEALIAPQSAAAA